MAALVIYCIIYYEVRHSGIHYLPHYYCLQFNLQNGLEPIQLAQMEKQMEVVELLSNKYGCHVDLAMLSMEVCRS